MFSGLNFHLCNSNPYFEEEERFCCNESCLCQQQLVERGVPEELLRSALVQLDELLRPVET